MRADSKADGYETLEILRVSVLLRVTNPLFVRLKCMQS